MVRGPNARFLRLVDDHGDMLLRAARLLCGDWTRAEGLLQQTLARTLIRWDPRRSDRDATTRVKQELVATYLDELPEEQHPPGPAPGPLLAGLGELDPVMRATVIGRYYLRLADRDIADLLGVEPGRARHVGVGGLARLDRCRRLAGTANPAGAG